MKILSADDDKDLLALIAFTLSQAGYLVVKAPATARARSGPSRAKRPDLVILDINMPGASGFQVCEAIRAQVARAGDDADGARRGGGSGAARSSSAPTTI